MIITLDELEYSEADNDLVLFEVTGLIYPIGGLQAQTLCSTIARGQKEVPLRYGCSYLIFGFLCRLLLIVQPFLRDVQIEVGGHLNDFMQGFRSIEDPRKLRNILEQWRVHLEDLDVRIVEQKYL